MSERIPEVRKGDRLRADTVNRITQSLADLTAPRVSATTSAAPARGISENLLRGKRSGQFGIRLRLEYN